MHWARAHGKPSGFNAQDIGEAEDVLRVSATVRLIVANGSL